MTYMCSMEVGVGTSNVNGILHDCKLMNCQENQYVVAVVATRMIPAVIV